MNAQLTPYLMSEDVRAQADAYIHALGGEILSIMTFGQMPGTPEAMKDKVMHMALRVAGNNTLFLSDSMKPVEGSRSILLALAFEDVAQAREAFGNISRGGTVKFPFELQPWGAYYGEVEDQFGVHWQIVKQ